MADQDVLNRTTQELRQRLNELEPLVEEQRRLQQALEALEGVEGSSGPQSGARRRGGRSGATRPRTRRTPSGRARRGQRQEQLLDAVRSNPGSRPADLARAVGVAPSQAHVLLRRLEESGQIERRKGAVYLREGNPRASSSQAGAAPSASTPKPGDTESSEGESLREKMSNRLLGRTEDPDEAE